MPVWLSTAGPALAAVALIVGIAVAIWLMRADAFYLLAGHIVSRVVLDSWSETTYQPLVAGLSIMQLYSVSFIGLAAANLFVQNGLRLHRYTMPLLAILAAAALSSVINRTWSEFATTALRWTYLWVLLSLTLSALQRRDSHRVFVALAIGGLCAFANQMYSVAIDAPKWGAGQWSYVGTFAHESDVSFLMVMLAPPGVYLLSADRGLWARLLGVACLVAAHIGLYYAAYRSLWVAMAGYWAFFLWSRYVRGSISSRAALLIATLGGISLGTAVLGPTVFEKMADLFDFLSDPGVYLDFSGDADEVYLMSGRIDLINAYMGIYLNSGVHVWLAGIGPAQGGKEIGLYAHNEYLSALVETGLFGLLALCWLLLRFLRDSVRLVSSEMAAAQGVAPFVMVIAISSLGTMPFQDMRAMLSLGVVLACIVHLLGSEVAASRGTAPRERYSLNLLEQRPVEVLQ